MNALLTLQRVRLCEKYILIFLATGVLQFHVQAQPAPLQSPAQQPSQQHSGGFAAPPTVLSPDDPRAKQGKTIAKYQSEKTTRDRKRRSGTGLGVFLGIDGGVATTSPDEPDMESVKNGFQLGAKGGVCIFTNDVSLDVGAGYFYNDLTGGTDKRENETATGTEELRNTRVILRTAYAEFSPKFRLGDYWQAGPLGQVMFGADTTFGTQIGKPRPTILAGLQLNFGEIGNDPGLRVGGQFLTDVNVLGRQIYLGLLSLQYVIPLVEQETVYKDKEVHHVKEVVRKERVEKAVERIIIKENARFIFDSQMINFETDRHNLSKNSETFLLRLGAFLKEKGNIWKEVIIEGHTDVRGTLEHNMRLSDNRAASVRRALIQGGILDSRIRSVGYGPTRPLDSGDDPVALARNRRVEFNFTGVTDEGQLREGIKRIQLAVQEGK
jgi:outer membrane protein OmpA-like peptidoglycan-associated protein